jgi:hypothetical protein
MGWPKTSPGTTQAGPGAAQGQRPGLAPRHRSSACPGSHQDTARAPAQALYAPLLPAVIVAASCRRNGGERRDAVAVWLLAGQTKAGVQRPATRVAAECWTERLRATRAAPTPCAVRPALTRGS